jgi:hypothetical protein
LSIAYLGMMRASRPIIERGQGAESKFPKEIAGRANAALNVFHIGGAFVLQEVIGWIINRWPTYDGHYPAIAYKAALALMIVLQVIAIIWFAQFDQKLQTFVAKVMGRWRSNRMIAASSSRSIGEE